MVEKVTDPLKKVTDPVLLSHLSKQGIDPEYVEFTQDYAMPAVVNGKTEKGKSPYAKFYRDLKSNKKFAVFSQLPMVDLDGVKVNSKWKVAGINFFESKNLFTAKVHGNQIRVTARYDMPDGRKAGDYLEWTPRLFLDGVEQSCGNAKLLAVDPLNPNIFLNTIEWDYGSVKRRIRVIEGIIRERWFTTHRGLHEIVHNPTGSMPLKYGYCRREDIEDIEVKVVGNTEILDTTNLPDSAFPVEIGASPETYNTGVDGRARRYVVSPGNTWADMYGGSGTQYYVGGVQDIYDVIQSSDASSKWARIDGRNPLLFDTSALPDDATITGGVLSLFGAAKAATAAWAHTSNIYACATDSPTGIIASDYDIGHWGAVLCDTSVAYAAFSIVGYNDFTLNATGIANISKIGVSYFGYRNANWDGANTSPTWGNNVYSYTNAWTTEKGAGYKPKLVVTYTAETDYPISSSVLIGELVGATKSISISRASQVLVGVLVSATRTWNSMVSSSVAIGVMVSASKIIDYVRSSGVLIGELVSATKAIDVNRSASVLIGELVSATRSFNKTRTASVSIGVKVTASRIVNYIRAASVLIGELIGATRNISTNRSSAVLIGELVGATRAIAISKSSSVLIGAKVSATRIVNYIRSSAVSIGLSVSVMVTLERILSVISSLISDLKIKFSSTTDLTIQSILRTDLSIHGTLYTDLLIESNLSSDLDIKSTLEVH